MSNRCFFFFSSSFSSSSLPLILLASSFSSSLTFCACDVKWSNEKLLLTSTAQLRQREKKNGRIRVMLLLFFFFSAFSSSPSPLWYTGPNWTCMYALLCTHTDSADSSREKRFHLIAIPERMQAKYLPTCCSLSPVRPSSCLACLFSFHIHPPAAEDTPRCLHSTDLLSLSLSFPVLVNWLICFPSHAPMFLLYSRNTLLHSLLQWRDAIQLYSLFISTAIHLLCLSCATGLLYLLSLVSFQCSSLCTRENASPSTSDAMHPCVPLQFYQRFLSSSFLSLPLSVYFVYVFIYSLLLPLFFLYLTVARCSLSLSVHVNRLCACVMVTCDVTGSSSSHWWTMSQVQIVLHQMSPPDQSLMQVCVNVSPL